MFPALPSLVLLPSGASTKGLADWYVALIFFGPIALGIAYLIYQQYHLQKWKKGVFPQKIKFTKDNLMEAYIRLAAFMIRSDQRDVAEKVRFIRSYFHRHFEDTEYNLNDSLKFCFEYPIQPKTVAIWIRKHIKDVSKRTQILYFLAGLAMIDGQIIQREYGILKEITPLLGFTEKELDAVINMYRQKKTDNRRSVPDSKKSLSQKEIAFKILELKIGSTFIEIKASHRRLVKLHHPDRFANESKEQIRLANERFQKIQEAYELLANA